MITTHPDADDLRAYAVGQGDTAAVEEHLAECEDCWRVVEEAQAGQHMVRVLRHLPLEMLGEGATPRFPAELRGHPRYRLLEFVGQGGMGQVWKARHRLLDRVVAIKVVRPELVRDADRLARFRREAQAVARLSHPNIVVAHDADEARGLHFLVMEYVQGKNLHQVVQARGPLAVAEACSFVRQAAVGLDHAHRAGVIHRDITAANLLLTSEGVVKVADFGLSVLREAPVVTGLTDPGLGMGTPDYTAPEQLQDAAGVDGRADIYALGCVLYLLLAGRPPFEGSNAEKAAGHLERDPMPLADLRRDLPSRLTAAVSRMMAKRPEDRYQSAAEVADALASHADEATLAIPPQPPRFPARVGVVAGVAVLLLALAWVAWALLASRTQPADDANDMPKEAERRTAKFSPSTAPHFGLSRIPVVKTRRLLEGHSTPVMAVAISDDGKRGYSVSRDNELRVWDMAVDRHKAHFAAIPPEVVRHAAFSPGGGRLFTVANDRTVSLKESESGKVVWTEAWGQKTTTAVFVAGGNQLLVGTADGRVRQVETDTGRQMAWWQAHKTAVFRLALTADEKRIATTSDDGEVCIWEDCKRVACWRLKPECMLPAVAFVGGRHLFCGAEGKDDTCDLREVETGRIVHAFEGMAQPSVCVAVSKDFRMSVVGNWNREARLHDLATGQLLAVLQGHAGPVMSVALAADGKTVLTGGMDSTVRVWNLDTAKPPP